uniref:Uncharacterized protein n=1 Tax=Ixodes scapularis TaxID=6945 RepID=A0A4D5RE28_IXOSC
MAHVARSGTAAIAATGFGQTACLVECIRDVAGVAKCLPQHSGVPRQSFPSFFASPSCSMLARWIEIALSSYRMCNV